MSKYKIVGTLAIMLTVGGCATTTEFRGDAHIQGGRESCVAICSAEGLHLHGMIIMGEYSSGCICAVPGSSLELSMLTAGAAGSGVAGVVIERERKEEQAATNATNQTVIQR